MAMAIQATVMVDPLAPISQVVINLVVEVVVDIKAQIISRTIRKHFLLVDRWKIQKDQSNKSFSLSVKK